MTKAEKQTKLDELRTEAKDYQARVGYLTLQSNSNKKEIEALKILLEAGNLKFDRISKEQTDSE